MQKVIWMSMTYGKFGRRNFCLVLSVKYWKANSKHSEQALRPWQHVLTEVLSSNQPNLTLLYVLSLILSEILFLSFLSLLLPITSTWRYTCQLFLRCRREIFILGVLGFLKTTRSFPKIPEEVRSLPKTSEVCRKRSYRENAYPQKQRSRGRYCHLLILHMVFIPYMGLS